MIHRLKEEHGFEPLALHLHISIPMADDWVIYVLLLMAAAILH
jgi:hypothetical protein